MSKDAHNDIYSNASPANSSVTAGAEGNHQHHRQAIKTACESTLFMTVWIFLNTQVNIIDKYVSRKQLTNNVFFFQQLPTRTNLTDVCFR